MGKLLRQMVVKPLYDLSRRIAIRRHSRLSRVLYNLATDFRAVADNQNFDMTSNGEHEVLRRLQPFASEFRTVYDVGANHGEWALTLYQRMPAVEIHCFELCRPTYKKLVEATKGIKTIHPWPLGLSDEAGTIDVYYAPGHDYLSAGHPLLHDVPTEKLSGQVVRGDAHAQAQGHERIDFVKIDVEGMEQYVLYGFEKMLQDRRIGIIQFEYGSVAGKCPLLLNGYYELLGKYGYAMGKVFPDGVRFKPYARQDESLDWANYVAVLADRQDLLQALASPDAQLPAAFS